MRLAPTYEFLPLRTLRGSFARVRFSFSRSKAIMREKAGERRWHNSRLCEGNCKSCNHVLAPPQLVKNFPPRRVAPPTVTSMTAGKSWPVKMKVDGANPSTAKGPVNQKG